MKMKIKHILKIFANFIFGILVLLLIAVISATIINAVHGDPRPPEICGYRLLNVDSGSMLPGIAPGDLVVVSQTKVQDIQKNDIISFLVTDSENDKNMQNNKIVTHRVINIVHQNGEVYFNTKGDHNNVADSWIVPESMLLGKVQFKIPFIGALLSREGILIMLGIITASMIAIIYINAAKLVKRKRGALDVQDSELTSQR